MFTLSKVEGLEPVLCKRKAGIDTISPPYHGMQATTLILLDTEHLVKQRGQRTIDPQRQSG